MSQLTEDAAEKLPQAQAAGLARVIDFQARWENSRDTPGRSTSTYTTPDLHGRQKAYEAFRAVRADYTAKYRVAQIPETTLSTPERVAAWCRAVRAVFRRAEVGETPAAAVEKAYRMADRIATRLKKDSLPRATLASLPDAIKALDAVIQWCEVLVFQPAVIGQVWAPSSGAVA